MIKKLIKGAFSVFVGRMLGLFANFGFLILLARELPPTEVGEYFFLLNLATFLAILSRYAVENCALKITADACNTGNNNTNNFLSILLFCSLTSLIVGLIYLAICQTLFPEKIYNTIGWLIISWFVMLGLDSVLAEVIRAYNYFFKAALTKGALVAVLNIVMFSGLVFTGYSITLETVLKIIVLNHLIVTCLALFWAIPKGKYWEKPDVTEVRKIAMAFLVLAFPLLINQLAMFITSQSDIWLVRNFYGQEATAYYGAAMRLVLFTGLALTIANGVLPPFISKYRVANQPQALESVVKVVATCSAIPACIAVAAFILVPDYILNFVYGPDYIAGVNILRILAVGQLVNVLVGSCGYVLMMYGHYKAFMKFSLFGGMASLTLAGISLVAGFDIIYIAISFSVGTIIQQLLMFCGCKKLTGISTIITLFKIRQHVQIIKA